MSNVASNKRKILSYSLWIMGFLIVSLLLGYFRGSDHGNLPSYSDSIPVQGADAYRQSDSTLEQGRMSIHYYWATWCGVCKANDPFLKASLSVLLDHNIQFLSWEEGSVSPSELKLYLESKGIAYPVAIASPRFLQESRIAGYPTTIFVDSSGKIRFVDTGIMNPISFWIRVAILKSL